MRDAVDADCLETLRVSGRAAPSEVVGAENPSSVTAAPSEETKPSGRDISRYVLCGGGVELDVLFMLGPLSSDADMFCPRVYVAVRSGYSR